MPLPSASIETGQKYMPDRVIMPISTQKKINFPGLSRIYTIPTTNNTRTTAVSIRANRLNYTFCFIPVCIKIIRFLIGLFENKYRFYRLAEISAYFQGQGR